LMADGLQEVTSLIEARELSGKGSAWKFCYKGIILL